VWLVRKHREERQRGDLLGQHGIVLFKERGLLNQLAVARIIGLLGAGGRQTRHRGGLTGSFERAVTLTEAELRCALHSVSIVAIALALVCALAVAVSNVADTRAAQKSFVSISR
jgi:hypothetical protein